MSGRAGLPGITYNPSPPRGGVGRRSAGGSEVGVPDAGAPGFRGRVAPAGANLAARELEQRDDQADKTVEHPNPPRVRSDDRRGPSRRVYLSRWAARS